MWMKHVGLKIKKKTWHLQWMNRFIWNLNGWGSSRRSRKLLTTFGKTPENQIFAGDKRKIDGLNVRAPCSIDFHETEADNLNRMVFV